MGRDRRHWWRWDLNQNRKSFMYILHNRLWSSHELHTLGVCKIKFKPQRVCSLWWPRRDKDWFGDLAIETNMAKSGRQEKALLIGGYIKHYPTRWFSLSSPLHSWYFRWMVQHVPISLLTVTQPMRIDCTDWPTFPYVLYSNLVFLVTSLS